MFTPAAALDLTPDQKRELERLARSGSSPQKIALRSKVLLLAHEGAPNHAIAETLNISCPTVLALRTGFTKDGMQAVTGVRRRKRAGKVLTPDLEQKILDATLKTRPGDGSTHWSVRMLARHLGVSRTIVHRVWQRHDVQPHRVERFQLSKDPHFEEKVRDIVGLYLNPPDRALVLCVDEKSQIQALDRTAPILPLRPGLPERQTHDYKRHGTTTLFAAFNILNGKVLGSCLPRHRGKEFLKFLNQLEKQCPRIWMCISSWTTTVLIRALPSSVGSSRRNGSGSTFTSPRQQFLAQSGGALVWVDHGKNDSTRHLSLRCRTRTRHLCLACKLERRAQTVRLEGHRRCHSRESPPL